MSKITEAKNWVLQHKTELIIAGGVILIIGGMAVGLKIKKDSPIISQFRAKPLKQVSSTKSPVTPNVIGKITEPSFRKSAPINPFVVREHIRNLPVGQCASPEKIAQAFERGVTLQSGQTLVDQYIKYNVA